MYRKILTGVDFITYICSVNKKLTGVIFFLADFFPAFINNYDPNEHLKPMKILMLKHLIILHSNTFISLLQIS